MIFELAWDYGWQNNIVKPNLLNGHKRQKWLLSMATLTIVYYLNRNLTSYAAHSFVCWSNIGSFLFFCVVSDVHFHWETKTHTNEYVMNVSISTQCHGNRDVHNVRLFPHIFNAPFAFYLEDSCVASPHPTVWLHSYGNFI